MSQRFAKPSPTPLGIYATWAIGNADLAGRFAPPPTQQECAALVDFHQRRIAKQLGLPLEGLLDTRSIALTNMHRHYKMREMIRLGYTPEQAWVNFFVSYRRSKEHCRSLEQYAHSVNALVLIDRYDQTLDTAGHPMHVRTETKASPSEPTTKPPVSSTAKLRKQLLKKAATFLLMTVAKNEAVKIEGGEQVKNLWKSLKTAEDSTSLPALFFRVMATVTAPDKWTRAQREQLKLFQLRLAKAEKVYESSELSSTDMPTPSRELRRQAKRLLAEIARESTDAEIAESKA